MGAKFTITTDGPPPPPLLTIPGNIATDEAVCDALEPLCFALKTSQRTPLGDDLLDTLRAFLAKHGLDQDPDAFAALPKDPAR